jgi:hypothetical protein
MSMSTPFGLRANWWTRRLLKNLVDSYDHPCYNLRLLREPHTLSRHVGGSLLAWSPPYVHFRASRVQGVGAATGIAHSTITDLASKASTVRLFWGTYMSKAVALAKTKYIIRYQASADHESQRAAYRMAVCDLERTCGMTRAGAAFLALDWFLERMEMEFDAFKTTAAGNSG